MKLFWGTMVLAALVLAALTGCSDGVPSSDSSRLGSTAVSVDPESLYGQASATSSAAAGPDQFNQTEPAGQTELASPTTAVATPAQAAVVDGHPAWADGDDGVPWGWGGYGLVPSIRSQFEPPAEQTKLVYDAQTTAMTACIKAKGLTYWTLPWRSGTEGSGGLTSAPDSGLGLLDPDYAAQWGYAYGVEWRSTPEVWPSSPPGYDTQDQDAYGQAQDECYQDPVIKALESADEKGIYQAMRELQDRADAAAAVDPAYTEALKGWSDCMAKSGYSYDSPMEPHLEYAKDRSEPGDDPATQVEHPEDIKYLGAKPEAKELDTAKADVACKAETNMVSLYRQALWAAQNAEIEANRPTIKAFQDIFTGPLKAAEEYLASHPGAGQ